MVWVTLVQTFRHNTHGPIMNNKYKLADCSNANDWELESPIYLKYIPSS